MRKLPRLVTEGVRQHQRDSRRPESRVIFYLDRTRMLHRLRSFRESIAEFFREDCRWCEKTSASDRSSYRNLQNRRGVERRVVNASRYNGVMLRNSPNCGIFRIPIIRHVIAIDDEFPGFIVTISSCVRNILKILPSGNLFAAADSIIRALSNRKGVI